METKDKLLQALDALKESQKNSIGAGRVIKSTGVRLCCGATLLYDFGFTELSAGYCGGNYDFAKELAFIRDTCDNAPGFVIAVLNTTQMREWWPSLSKLGFSIASTSKNRNHSTNMYFLTHSSREFNIPKEFQTDGE